MFDVIRFGIVTWVVATVLFFIFGQLFITQLQAEGYAAGRRHRWYVVVASPFVLPALLALAAVYWAWFFLLEVPSEFLTRVRA